MVTKPLRLDYEGGLGPTYNGIDDRQADTVLHAGPSAGQVFSGIRGGQVSVVGTAITIQPLSYVINGGSAPGSEGAYRGMFVAGDTANLSKTLTAAHSTLDRIDSVRVRVYNHNADGSGRREHVIEYQAGTPGSGTGPTLPVTSYEIATIAVPHTGAGSPAVTMVGKPYTGPGGARPGTTVGDLEVYDIATGTWKRIWQSVGAHFQGGYDPGTASSIANSTWTPMPITDIVSSSRVTLIGGNALRVDEAGLYQCNGQVRLNTGTASGTGWCRFSVNGVEKKQNPVTLPATALTLPLACQLRLNASDLLRFEVFQGQGSSRLFSNGVLWNFIDIARVS